MDLSHKRSLIWAQIILIATKQIVIRGDRQSAVTTILFPFSFFFFEKVGKRNIYL